MRVAWLEPRDAHEHALLAQLPEFYSATPSRERLRAIAQRVVRSNEGDRRRDGARRYSGPMRAECRSRPRSLRGDAPRGSRLRARFLKPIGRASRLKKAPRFPDSQRDSPKKSARQPKETPKTE